MAKPWSCLKTDSTGYHSTPNYYPPWIIPIFGPFLPDLQGFKRPVDQLNREQNLLDTVVTSIYYL
jgi:hypothetical protein